MTDITSHDASLPDFTPGIVEGEAEIDRRRIADLIDQIKLSADKLATDRTSRGDLNAGFHTRSRRTIPPNSRPR